MIKNLNMKKLEINLMLAVTLFYSLFILTSDYITYFFNLKYIFSILISFILNLTLFLFIRKKIRIINNFSKYDFLFFLLLISFSIVSVVYPDRTFDTFNYHLYLQENPFGDKIFDDFFAAKNLNTFTYAFTDRFAYFFRYLLGYRLGVSFNYFVLITIYYQAKKIMQEIVDSKINNLVLCIFSLMCTLSLSTIELADSYYIDNISVIYLSELFYLVFSHNENNFNLMLPYIGLLCGFSFVSKISNAFVILILFIFYIIKNKEIITKINLKTIICTLFTFLAPFFIYMFYTYLSTGNPVFPFYNSIFKSPYYSNTNWLDTRFGPKSIIETLLWPILMLKYPNRTYDIAIVEPMWAIGYIVCIAEILKNLLKKIIFKKEFDNNLILYIFIFISYFVWARFMLGYTRYGLSILFFGIMGLCLYLYNILFIKKDKILISITIVLLSYNYIISLNYFVNCAHSWTFSNKFAPEYANISYKQNLRKLFKDRNEKILLENDSIIGIGYYNAGYVTLLTKDTKMVSLTSGVSNKKTEKIFDKKINNVSKIYSIIDAVDFDNFINELNNQGYYIRNIKDTYNSNLVLENNFTYVFEIEKSDVKNNVMEISNKYYFDLENGTYDINFFTGLGKYMRNMYFENFNIELIKEKRDEIEVLNSIKLRAHDGKLKLFHNSTTLNDNERLAVRIVDNEGNEQEYIAIMLLNININKIN